MDELDRKLLTKLEENPRTSSAKLAKELGSSKRTISKRLERLISSYGLVFTALPDLNFFGYLKNVYILIHLESQSSSDQIAKQICDFPQIRFVSACKGFADITCVGDFKSNEELVIFVTHDLGQIHGISQIETMIELQSIKKMTFGRFAKMEQIESTKRNITDISVDGYDYNLILELQKDSRASLKKLSTVINLSKPAIHRRIIKLINAGIIQLTAISDPSKIGYPTRSIILISAVQSKMFSIAKIIAQYNRVTHVGIYSGPVKLFVGAYASSPEDILQFATKELSTIDGILRTDLLIHTTLYKTKFAWIR